jgi:hypothetical protein
VPPPIAAPVRYFPYVVQQAAYGDVNNFILHRFTSTHFRARRYPKNPFTPLGSEGVYRSAYR